MAQIEWSQGNTYSLQDFQLIDQGAPLVLTGVNASSITLHIRPIEASSNYVALQGTTTIITPTTGSIAYQFASTDIAVAGSYYLVIWVDFGGGHVWKSYPFTFEILPA